MAPQKKIGFIGTGVMGGSMAKHLISAGYLVLVHNRTKEKSEELLKEGANWCDSVADVARRSEVVITIVGFPSDVEEIYFGPDGILENAPPGTVAIDMTTSAPKLAKRIYSEGIKRGIRTLDAPVSGGDRGARAGTLSIMVGGDKEIYDRVHSLFEIMGKNIVYQGPAGSGQHTKMCNQIAIASNMTGVCEAIAYAWKSGLDPQTVLKSIESGAAGSWSLSNLGPKMIESDYTPGFYVKHFIKDMRLAAESAGVLELETPGLNLALRLYEKLAAEGGADEGTQALMRLFDRGDLKI